MRKIAISDCDHISMDEEKQLFGQNNIQMDLYQCKTEEELIRNLQGYEAVGTQYAPFTERVFANLPGLKALVRYGVGVDNIDVKAAARHNVSVCNVPDYGVQEVASHALTLMLALTRKLLIIDKSMRAGRWAYEDSIPIFRLSELTVGIIGLGRIGKCFAQQVRGLGVRVLATDPLFPRTAGECCEFVQMTSLEDLLKQSDIISLHCPLESSRNLIGEPQLRAMKETAYLINVSRGGIIDEAALEQALENHWIAGAACDVLAQEPPVNSCPLLRFENYIGTPHMAWYSLQASRDLKRKLAEELVRYLDGETLLYKLMEEVS